MAFVDTLLPPTVLLGSSAGPVWDVDVIEYGQGSRYVNRKVLQSRYRFTLRHIVERADIFADVVSFFEALGGPATGFLIHDWLDNSTAMGGTTSAGDQNLGTGDGSTTVFNLNRTYTVGTATATRRIWKPKTGTVKIEVNSVDQTVVYDTTPGAGEVSIDTSTGIATFGTAPTDTHDINWGGEYYYPVALEGAQMDGIIGPDVWYELSPLTLIELLDPT